MRILNLTVRTALAMSPLIGALVTGCATNDANKANLIPIATDKAALGDPMAKSFYATKSISDINVYKVGDVADVQVFNEAGLSGKYSIDSQGNSNFPYLGIVKVAGLTNLQLQEKLTQLYGQDYFQNPSVLVKMEAQGLGNIIIDGAVSQPGVIALTDSISLTEAIARVGGLVAEGDSESVFVVRQTGTERTPFRVDLDAVRLAQAPDPILVPSDVIFVQKEGEKFDYDDILRAIPVLNFALIAATRF